MSPAFLAVIHECIERAYENDPCGTTRPASGKTLAAVLNERFPIDSSGVGHANRRAQTEIRQQIADFYAPRDWSPEPTTAAEFA